MRRKYSTADPFLYSHFISLPLQYFNRNLICDYFSMTLHCTFIAPSVSEIGSLLISSWPYVGLICLFRVHSLVYHRVRFLFSIKANNARQVHNFRFLWSREFNASLPASSAFFPCYIGLLWLLASRRLVVLLTSLGSFVYNLSNSISEQCCPLHFSS